VVDLDRVAALHATARLAVRAEPGETDLAGEGRITLAITEGSHLVIERRDPDVRIVGEPSHEVVGERCERVGC